MASKTRRPTAERIAQVGSVAWVLHDDSPQGFSASIHGSENGAFLAALERIKAVVKDKKIEDDDLLAAIKEGDGRAALSALNAIINEVGGEGVGNVYLWVAKQKVME